MIMIDYYHLLAHSQKLMVTIENHVCEMRRVTHCIHYTTFMGGMQNYENHF